MAMVIPTVKHLGRGAQVDLDGGGVKLQNGLSMKIHERSLQDEPRSQTRSQPPQDIEGDSSQPPGPLQGIGAFAWWVGVPEGLFDVVLAQPGQAEIAGQGRSQEGLAATRDAIQEDQSTQHRTASSRRVQPAAITG